jgi:hypothetical protein
MTGTNGREKEQKGARGPFLELPKSGGGLLPNTGKGQRTIWGDSDLIGSRLDVDTDFPRVRKKGLAVYEDVLVDSNPRL